MTSGMDFFDAVALPTSRVDEAWAQEIAGESFGIEAVAKVGLAWLAAGVVYPLVLTRGLRVAPPAMDFSESTGEAAVAQSSAGPR